ncbi:MAG: 1-(5-phosphoribosyl)-5-((5-phosphoribosylamino)methylideneamino) imidazole-4-carboxamide isomerase [Actinomycetia bacterium]|nr:1-(5-phosphoribosyl)-5-((5-phosphoribosylamino)methylideneamino) imidazole-4-carboxamide isomerase [Actinomycetes bacterium]
MEFYPAIDLRGGKVVQLRQGDYGRETVYGDDPVAVARWFAEAGATWVHVVDLDAARDGGAANLRAIEEMCIAVDCKVQTGGGIRSVDDAAERFAAGVARVVVGSAAVERPELVDELAAMSPGQVAVGLDARGRDVATHGWKVASGKDLTELVRRFDLPGVGALVVTDIGRDGMLAGPDVEGLRSVLANTTVPVIASGGVSSLADLESLAAIEVDGRRLAGAIAGTAVYEHRFTVEEGIEACSQPA